MAIKILLEDGTQIECETASLARDVLTDAVREEKEASGAKVRERLYKDALAKKMDEYELGNLDKCRSAINTVVAIRTWAALGNKFDTYNTKMQRLYHIGEDMVMLQILDEILPSKEEK